MFTGIIEALGKVERVAEEKGNCHFWIVSPFNSEVQVDESIAHNGVCLTVVDKTPTSYIVTAVEETLKKTGLSSLKEGSWVNLERALRLGERLDGHIVQGHVDLTGSCQKIEPLDGSWLFSFGYDEAKAQGFFPIEKGSIAVDGISLTTFDCQSGQFKVSIIPYSFENTNLQFLSIGEKVNLEFDLMGKYAISLAKKAMTL